MGKTIGAIFRSAWASFKKLKIEKMQSFVLKTHKKELSLQTRGEVQIIESALKHT